MTQGGGGVAFGVASFARERTGDIAYSELAMPQVPSPADCRSATRDELGLTGWADGFDMRPCIGGPPFGGSPSAYTGGWIKPVDDRALDAASVAGLTDSWLPSIRTRLTVPTMMQPTVELSIHFLARSAGAYRSSGRHLFIEVRSASASGGFWEEDATIWSPDGVALVRSRQLAVIR
jgi:hypothetical protein